MAARIAVILLAAGTSSRMDGVDKLWADLGGQPVIARSLATIAQINDATDVVVVTPASKHDDVKRLADDLRIAVRCVEGGARRQDSVACGLTAIDEADSIIVHDAARPLASLALFERVLAAARAHGAAVPALPVIDTVKRVDAGGRIIETLDRAALRAVQTPQAFAASLLRRAHAEVREEATDDASMVEALGEPVITVPGERENLKVTTPHDLLVAEAMLAAQEIEG